MSQPELPLDNVKVADFSWGVAGPAVSTLLGFYGAEVVKVESTHTPELTRVSTPYKDGIPGINRSIIFNRMNVNKYSVRLNLNHARGQEIARRLGAWADIVVDSSVLGSMEKRGLGYDDFKKVNDDVIVLSTTSQGQTGSYARHPGYGFQLVALCGFTEVTGWRDREPSLPPGVYTDLIAPWFGVCAVLAAVEFRDRTGRGQHIDLSQVETGLQMLIPAVLRCSADGYIWSRDGNRSLTDAPHAAYRCLGDDRWCAIAVTGDEEWRAFCRAMGNPEWTRQPGFATALARKQNEEELDKLVEAWTVNLTAEEVMARLQSAGVPAGVVQNNKDLWSDPQIKHRGHFQTVRHPEIGEHTAELPPMRFSRFVTRVRRPAPCLGEHTEYVCCQLLGMSNEEFVEALGEGVFE